MSLVKAFKEGDLVFIEKPDGGALGPLCPIKTSGVGLIVKVKSTRIFPGPREENFYAILLNGEVQDILKENINKINVDI